MSQKISAKPPFFALMGPDGVGKSSILEYLTAHLEIPEVNGLVAMDRGSMPPPTDPRLLVPYPLPAHNFILSILKLLMHACQWIFDYCIGKIARARAKGYIVAFDRYYFLDMYLDPLRYRYGKPLSLVKFAAKILPNPDFIILLDAPAEVLFARKVEFSLAGYERLRTIYREALMGKPNTYLIDTAQQPLEATAEQIRAILRNRLAQQGK
jgi:thymidylate kinase